MAGGAVPTAAGRKKGKEADRMVDKMLAEKDEVKDVPAEKEEDAEESEEESEQKEGEEASKKTKKPNKAKKTTAEKEEAATKTEAAPVVSPAEAAKLAQEDLERRIAEQEKEHLKLRLKAQRNQGLAMLLIAVIGFFYAHSKDNGELPPLSMLLERLGPGLLATFGTIVALTLISKYIFGTVG